MRGKLLLGRPWSRPWPKMFVTQMLTLDLFAVANFLVLFVSMHLTKLVTSQFLENTLYLLFLIVSYL